MDRGATAGAHTAAELCSGAFNRCQYWAHWQLSRRLHPQPEVRNRRSCLGHHRHGLRRFGARWQWHPMAPSTIFNFVGSTREDPQCCGTAARILLLPLPTGLHDEASAAAA